MRWFLQVIGLEVTVLGRVGHNVILAAPLPAPLARLQTRQHERLQQADALELLARADVCLAKALGWKPALDADGHRWRH